MRLNLSQRVPAAECAHLGTAADPFTRGAHANDEHRCYARLVGERIDLTHQRRFCLTSAHNRCPFLLVSGCETESGWRAEARAWWRTVSPAHPALTAAQPGNLAGLGAAAAHGVPRSVFRVPRSALGVGGLGQSLVRQCVGASLLVLQTWRTVRPQPSAPLMAVGEEPVHVEQELPMVVHEHPVHEGDERPDVEHTQVRSEEEGPFLCVREQPAPAHTVDRHALLAYAQPRAEKDRSALTVRDEALRPPLSVHEQPPLVELGHPTVVHEQTPTAVVEPAGSPAADAREWFRRAKHAETLDDLVTCLERAHVLEPENEMIAFNLEWATQRRDASRLAKKAKPKRAADPTPALRSAMPRRPGVALRLVRTVVDLCRATIALGALALGASLLLSALPGQLRETLLSTIGLPASWLPDASSMTSLVHVPIGGGYDLGQALPYTLAFLALFTGMGLLHREPSPGGHR